MDKLQDFNSFSSARRQEVQIKLEQEKDAKRSSSAENFKSLLAEYGVTELNELDEEQKAVFFSRLRGNEVNEDVNYMIDKLEESYGSEEVKETEETEEVTEAEVKSDEEFNEYATTVLKKAFGDDFDEAKAQETIDGILSKADGDYGAAVGMLTSSLGESVQVNEADIKSDEDFKEYAFTVLKKAFGDEFDEAKAQEVIDGILSKSNGDYGQAAGMLQSSLG
jgi:formylmethanofuran dehydrogenase subunit E-like metal-binding protein